MASLLIISIVPAFSLAAENGVAVLPNDGQVTVGSLSNVSLIAPSGIVATSDAAAVYVAGRDSNTVYSFDSAGTFLFSFGAAQLTTPTGIDLTSDDAALYVCSSGSNDVHTFDAVGTPLFCFTGDSLTNPTDVVITSDDAAVYVASRDTNDVKVFDAVGAFLFSFSNPAMDLDPTGLALTSDDAVLYVSSAATNSIEAFDATGTHIGTIASIAAPADVALTSDDSLLYATSSATASIEVFDSLGGPVATLGGGGEVTMDSEIAITLDDAFLAVSGFILIDCNNNGIPDDCEFPGCPGLTRGDLTCDGAVAGNDIQPFVNHILCDTYMCQADINQDGTLDILDVPDFVACLVSGSCP